MHAFRQIHSTGQPPPAPADRSAADPALGRLKTQVVGAIAASYVLDALLLAGYVQLGVLAAWVPLWYALLGVGECTCAYALVRRRARARRDPYLTRPRLAVSCAIQLLFVALAPAVGLYFIGVLGIVFAFAALRARPRDACIALALVAVALSLLLGLGGDPLALPHATPGARALSLLAMLATLARITLLGLYSSYLRSRIGCRYREVRSSLEVVESDRTRTSVALHEDIGQDLAGVALLLSACSERLRRGHGADATEIETAAAQLRTTVEKARVLAFPSLPRLSDPTAPRAARRSR